MSRPANPVTAAVSGLLALGLLLALPALAAADPTLGVPPRPGGTGWWIAVLVPLAQAVVVAWISRAPAPLLLVLTALPLFTAWATPGPAFSPTTVAPLAGAFLAAVALPRAGSWRVLGAAALLLALGHGVNGVRGAGADLGSATVTAVAQALLVIGLPTLLGLVVVARQEAGEARRQEVLALHRERAALLAAESARRRTALSRELHDIAAHHLSGIAVMAAAIGRQIDTDPDAAKRSAGQVREQSRAVLDDIRRLVGLLRTDDRAGSDPAAGEDLLAVPALVDEHRAAGRSVELVMADDLPESGPLTQLVAYRMVQESLVNASVHAPGARCLVSVGPGPGGALALSVLNGPATGPDPGPGGGWGLVGMAERARLVGADLTHGPTADGGWKVSLMLPAGESLDRLGSRPTVLPEASA